MNEIRKCKGCTTDCEIISSLYLLLRVLAHSSLLPLTGNSYRQLNLQSVSIQSLGS